MLCKGVAGCVTQAGTRYTPVSCSIALCNALWKLWQCCQVRWCNMMMLGLPTGSTVLVDTFMSIHVSQHTALVHSPHMPAQQSDITATAAAAGLSALIACGQNSYSCSCSSRGSGGSIAYDSSALQLLCTSIQPQPWHALLLQQHRLLQMSSALAMPWVCRLESLQLSYCTT
jgi:hypothetical protein